jgi:hypothetical protein
LAPPTHFLHAGLKLPQAPPGHSLAVVHAAASLPPPTQILLFKLTTHGAPGFGPSTHVPH